MFVSHYVSTQVTAAAFWDDYLFVGQGSALRVYHVSTADGVNDTRSEMVNHLLSFTAFQTRNLSIIKPDNKPSSDEIRTIGIRICVTGGRVFRILRFQRDNRHSVRFEGMSPAIKLGHWILDVRWLCDKNGLVLLTAQNYVILWDVVSLRQIRLSECPENCILYSGILVGDTWKDLTIFSGTVFSEILVWNAEQRSVAQRLKGHNGVIFSIHYHAAIQTLCTSSDDRTIQIWKHGYQNINDSDCSLSLSNNSFKLLSRLYGHEARVFHVLSTSKWIVSAGEDSLLCFWFYDEEQKCSKLCHKLLAHNGSSIRSLATNELGTLLATGGEDGGVKVWNIGEHLKRIHQNVVDIREHMTQVYAEVNDYIRSFRILDESHVMIITNNGLVLSYNSNLPTGNQMSSWFQNERLHAHSVVDIIESPSEIMIAIGHLDGEISILRIATNANKALEYPKKPPRGFWKPSESKILSLKWLSTSLLLICSSPHGKLDLFTIGVENCDFFETLLSSTHQLPLCRKRWFSDAAIVVNEGYQLLLCGTPDGSLYLYATDNTLQQLKDCTSPVQRFPRIHGSHGVTHICVSYDGQFVLTTGRDGFIRTFHFLDGSLRELNKRWVSGCSKWIAGCLSVSSRELLVYGFQADGFVLWSEQHETSILDVRCGGGHRAWDFSIRNGVALFGYLKDGQIHMCTARLKDHTPVTLMPGSHKRQICDVHYLMTCEQTIYFGSANEDTTVRISAISKDFQDGQPLEEIAVLKTHISSVRAMASCVLPNKDGANTGMLLVTCGGRAQITVWTLTAKSGRIDSRKVLVEQVISHLLFSANRGDRKPWLRRNYAQDPETRYMDVAVWPTENRDRFLLAICCSDACFRLFGLNMDCRMMELIMEDSHHDHCMLKLKQFRFLNKLTLVMTTATDGKAILWDVTALENGFVRGSTDSRAKWKDGNDDSGHEMSLHKRVHEMKLHQSGITALDIRPLSRFETSSHSSRFAIVTGGDDTALNAIVLELSLVGQDLGFREISRSTIQIAHSAQITDALILDDDRFVTVSGDQNLATWRLHQSQIVFEECVISSVADISSAAVLDHEKDGRYLIAVAGIGLEIFEMRPKTD